MNYSEFEGKRWSLQAADKAASASRLKDFSLFTGKKSKLAVALGAIPSKPPAEENLHAHLGTCLF